MSTLVLRLSAPLQSWGTRSRFAYRATDPHPSKSGVLGLLAAAQGRRRTDPLEDLLGLRFGVRKDQPGRLVRDFQTARPTDGRRAMPITYRFYLADAVFLAGVEGERELIDGLQDALRRPRFPLYLGRRSCPPEGRILQDLHESDLEDTLGTGDHGRRVSWQAATWWRRRQGPHVGLEIVRDARPDEVGHDLVNDTPVSFDPAHRRYAARSVVHEWTDVDNPDSLGDRAGHEPMDMLGGF